MNKIKKGDTVRNINPINVPYGNRVVPAQTDMVVWKAARNGKIYCSTIDRSFHSGSIELNASDVTKVEKPLPTVKVGDVFVSSWGYDQTNIDYYIVRSVKKATVVISPLGQTRKYTGSMQGECVPNLTQIGDRTITKRIQRSGSNGVCLKLTSYSWAYPWNGQTNHFTEWA